MSVARQPFLHDSHVALWAPTQVWSEPTGEMSAPIHGIYHADTRVVSHIQLQVEGTAIEWIHHDAPQAHTLIATALLRGVDGPGADPRVRLRRRRQVRAGQITEELTITSARDVAITVPIQLRILPDHTQMHQVKAGLKVEASGAVEINSPHQATCGQQGNRLTWRVQGATFSGDGDWLVAAATLHIAPHTCESIVLSGHMESSDAVVLGQDDRPQTDVSALVTAETDLRLRRWVMQSAQDLQALRMSTAALPAEDFIAAGAPWFLTLFGRDSLWCARFLIPVDVALAGSTLRTLAHFQGTKVDDATGEQPGKIMHELRPHVVEIPEEGVSLPPLYYGTIDATPLWIITLHEAWKAGLPTQEVRELLSTLTRALAWMDAYGDADGDLFLEYHDASGTGLANQGWKDSGDSIQWRDGRLADGPIALSEVQGYAYQAAMHGAELLDAFGSDDDARGGDYWRSWAQKLQEKFRATFWVSTEEGRYPAVALDVQKQPVDTLTSNIGHLLGTGILNTAEAAQIAELLTSQSMSSGFGLRTLSDRAAGFWELSYHGGSVWTHDTAIVVQGLAAEGLMDAARELTEGLLKAAEAFEYRMPELYSGDDVSTVYRPAPYPASCRPQGWAASAAIAVAAAMNGK